MKDFDTLKADNEARAAEMRAERIARQSAAPSTPSTPDAAGDTGAPIPGSDLRRIRQFAILAEDARTLSILNTFAAPDDKTANAWRDITAGLSAMIAFATREMKS